MTITKPQKGTYPDYLDSYINKVSGDNVLEQLLTVHYDTIDLITSIDLETQHFRYAPDKWNIKEIIQHIMDSERVFTYRAMCIARMDKTPLPGFDENHYAMNAHASLRNMNDIAREFSVLRASSIELFKSFTEEMIQFSGVANGKPISVSALIYATLGHEIHHMEIINQRYLGN